jgi:hypothetical protein
VAQLLRQRVLQRHVPPILLLLTGHLKFKPLYLLLFLLPMAHHVLLFFHLRLLHGTVPLHACCLAAPCRPLPLLLLLTWLR